MTRIAALLVGVALLAGCGDEAAAPTTTRTAAAPRPQQKGAIFAPIAVSSNWSGYAATKPAGGRFTRATGAWRVPRVSCRAGTGTSVAFWVGIGGFSARSPSLQQLGVSADCSPAGDATYRVWTEIVPAPPTFLTMRVGPGDRMSATVTVTGRAIGLTIANLTRKTRYATRVVSKRALDVSSAEWVAEAPSLCRTISVCEVVPLSNFGTVTFDSVAAEAGANRGTLSSRSWSIERIALVTSTTSNRYTSASNPYGAVPGPLPATGQRFAVAFRSHLGGATTPAHPLPGAPLPSWAR
jgi:Peptidase A4 family